MAYSQPDSGQGEVVLRVFGRLGLPPLTAPEGAPPACSRDGSLAPEAYRLTLASGGSTLAARDESGAFHGAVSLLWLRAVHGGRPPSGLIEDAPRFAWRGQHLDCARHFFGVDSILSLSGIRRKRQKWKKIGGKQPKFTKKSQNFQI